MKGLWLVSFILVLAINCWATENLKFICRTPDPETAIAQIDIALATPDAKSAIATFYIDENNHPVNCKCNHTSSDLDILYCLMDQSHSADGNKALYEILYLDNEKMLLSDSFIEDLNGVVSFREGMLQNRPFTCKK